MANMNPKKCPMPSQDPSVRKRNFMEVATGYTYEMAYAKLVIAYSLFENEQERNAFINNEYNFEITV